MALEYKKLGWYADRNDAHKIQSFLHLDPEFSTVECRDTPDGGAELWSDAALGQREGQISPEQTKAEEMLRRGQHPISDEQLKELAKLIAEELKGGG